MTILHAPMRPAPPVDVNGITVQEWRDQVVAFARHRGWLTYWTEGSIVKSTGFPALVLVRSLAGAERRVIFAQLHSARANVTRIQREWLHGLAEVAALCDGHLEVADWRPQDWVAVRRILL